MTLTAEKIGESSSQCLQGAFIPELGGYYAGKVRDNYTLGEKRLMIATDRISCFDVVLPDLIPHKGAVLNLMSAFFFKKTESIVPNHLEEVIHPHAMITREVKTIPVEFIVRGYITGSAWAKYTDGCRQICGIDIPDGLSRNEKLPSPVLTPTLKVRDGHDEDTTRDKIIRDRVLTAAQYDRVEKICLELFDAGQKICREKGVILVDTKYECGLKDGKVVLIDEIHTPDSSRFWDEEEYHRLFAAGEDPADISKEKVRKFLKQHGFQGEKGVTPPPLPPELISDVSLTYRSLYERLTGDTFNVEDHTPALSLLQALRERGIIRGAFVPIIMGSVKDLPFGEKVLEELKTLGFQGAIHSASAHKQTREVLSLLERYNRSLEPMVFITIAGRSNALSGVIAANTHFPVIACPPFKDQQDYLINIHSTLQMPSGVPVLTVIDAGNAALACSRIFSMTAAGQKALLHEGESK